MFNANQMQGILLSVAKPEIHVARSDSNHIGYRIRVRVNIRGSQKFLEYV